MTAIAWLFYWTGAWCWACATFALAALAGWRLLAWRTPLRRKAPSVSPPCPPARTAPLIVAYDPACSPHPLHDDVVWVSTDNAAEAWQAIGGSAA